MSKIKLDNSSKKNNQEDRNSLPIPDSTIMVLYNISRNVNKQHLSEIFSPYGEIRSIVWSKDQDTKLLKNYVFIEFNNYKDAERASLYFGGGQIDGLVVRTEIIQYPKMVTQNKSRSPSKEKRSNSLNDKQVEKNGRNRKSRSRSRHHRRGTSKEYEDRGRNKRDTQRR